MKLRNPRLISAAAWAGSWLVRAWVGTVQFRYRPLGEDVDPHRPQLPRRYIYAFWHENMLLLARHFGRPDIRVLISTHADGQLIAECCRHLGFGLVRGSTTRGGVEAVRQMLRARGSHLAITPDGPRGPRRTLQLGAVYLAARTGLPIVPVGIGYQRPWRMNSWDQFALPRPFSRGTCVTADPIFVPAELDRSRLEEYRLRVERELCRVGELAELWAESGNWPGAEKPAAGDLIRRSA
jgi:hypothetical protein